MILDGKAVASGASVSLPIGGTNEQFVIQASDPEKSIENVAIVETNPKIDPNQILLSPIGGNQYLVTVSDKIAVPSATVTVAVSDKPVNGGAVQQSKATFSANFVKAAPPPPVSHLTCQNFQCKPAEGAGANECATDASCGHSTCQNGQCKLVAGAGANECATDANCGHSACQNNQCTRVAGAGADQCKTNDECAPKIGKALKFDGYNDYVNVNPTPQLSPQDAITVMAWVKKDKQDKPTDVDNAHFVRKGSEYTLDTSDNGAILRFTVNGQWGLGLAPYPNDGEWHHVAGTYDKNAGKIRTYIDGIQLKESPYATSITPSPQPLRIGARNDLYTQNMKGLIDEVCIYNRALATDEIKNIKQSGCTANMNGIVGYWPFDEGEGNIVMDYSNPDEAYPGQTAFLLNENYGSKFVVNPTDKNVGKTYKTWDEIQQGLKDNDTQTAGPVWAEGILPENTKFLAKRQAAKDAGSQSPGLSLNGLNEYLVVAPPDKRYVSDLYTLTLGNFSVCGWFKAKDRIAGVIGNGINEGGSFVMHIAGYGMASRSLRMRIIYSGGSTEVNAYLPDNNFWHFGCGVVDDKNVSIYLDSEIGSSALFKGTKTKFDGNIFIGTTRYLTSDPKYCFNPQDSKDLSKIDTEGCSAFMRGGLKDIQIFKRALTPAEIREQYNFSFGKPADPGKDKDLIAYWKFNEEKGVTKIADASTYRNDALLTEGSTGPKWGNGILGGGIELDGINDFIALGTSPTLNMADKNFSICTWLKTADTTKSIQDIFSNSMVSNTPGTYRFSVRGGKMGGDIVYGNSQNAVSSNKIVNDNQWHFGCQVVDDVNNNIYVDGVLEKSQALSGTKTKVLGSTGVPNNRPVYIGLIYPGYVRGNFGGVLDELSVWGKALSAEEIKSLYNNGSGLAVTSQTELLGLWHLDEVQGDFVYDSSDNSNHGVLKNEPAIIP
ncbi:MAG: LamG domain-containing protein [Deltaproteobacteria bacterium]|nr:LamG domain-containing protein [Deltaproteobacteria bacterium]